MPEPIPDSPGHFCRALTAPGLKLPPKSDIYAPLIGSWTMELIDYAADVTPHRQRGEWHFSRALEGRAVQDVLIAPPQDARSGSAGAETGNRFGSTLRIYDFDRDVWRLAWFNPVTGVESHLTGRREGDRIVQTGPAPDGAQMRWTFSDITPDSFTWRGESSADDGQTWRLEAEFFARRFSNTIPGNAEGRRRLDLLWASPDRDRLEHVQLAESTTGFEADGLILRRGEAGDLRIRYRIGGDHNWRVRSLHIESLDSSRNGVALTSDGAGHWTGEDGRRLPALDGCMDVDLHASPFTNTIAIRRLSLQVGEAGEIRAAFVAIPELSVEPAQQRYTRLPSTRQAHHYRYEGLDTDFVTELPVDDDGLLYEYPGYFHRLWPGKVGGNDGEDS